MNRRGNRRTVTDLTQKTNLVVNVGLRNKISDLAADAGVTNEEALELLVDSYANEPNALIKLQIAKLQRRLGGATPVPIIMSA